MCQRLDDSTAGTARLSTTLLLPPVHTCAWHHTTTLAAVTCSEVGAGNMGTWAEKLGNVLGGLVKT